MKKLLYLLLAITIISCGGDDDDCTNITVNPPSWLLYQLPDRPPQCYYRLENEDGTLGDTGFSFNVASFGEATWFDNGLELIVWSENAVTDFCEEGMECCVYEEMSNDRYYLEITLGQDQYSWEFEKISEDRIRYLQTPTTVVILLRIC